MINIICIGKLKEKYLIEACNEYTKRLGKFAKINLIEVKQSNQNLYEEAKKIKKYINKNDYIIVLDIQGNQLASEQLALKINDILMIKPNITFIIGGSLGLHEEIKNICDMKLSFSKMTFPHQLFRVLLLEQLYRAFKIINNETYHK